MTLSHLRAEYPEEFYEQDWFDGEAFMEREGDDNERLSVPTGLRVPKPGYRQATALYLAESYILDPDAPIWQRFLWTSDHDDLGQRIYVGGIGQAKKPGFQIHRHLNVNTLQWGWPTWKTDSFKMGHPDRSTTSGDT